MAKLSKAMAASLKLLFTEEEQQRVQRAASAVWDEVAYDLLTAVAEEKHKRIEQVSIPRSQVIEIALDAGRLEERLSTWPDLLQRIKALNYETLIALVRPAFPDIRYGY